MRVLTATKAGCGWKVVVRPPLTPKDITIHRPLEQELLRRIRDLRSFIPRETRQKQRKTLSRRSRWLFFHITVRRNSRDLCPYYVRASSLSANLHDLALAIVRDILLSYETHFSWTTTRYTNFSDKSHLHYLLIKFPSKSIHEFFRDSKIPFYLTAFHECKREG